MDVAMTGRTAARTAGALALAWALGLGATSSAEGATAPANGAIAISEIQGTGQASPLAGQTATTRGVVTAVYPTGGFDGAYIQTPGSGGAGRRSASDGLFVHSRRLASSVKIGEYVEVKGKVTEFHGLTEINASSFSKLDEKAAPPVPVPLTAVPDDVGKEALEGMLVDVRARMTISNNYETNRYGQLGVAFGEEPLRQPSDVFNPTADREQIEKLSAANAARSLTLDDGLSWAYTGAKNAHPEVPLPYLSQQSPARVGSAISLKRPAVLDFRKQWNLQPVSPVTGEETGDRSSEYVEVENTRKAAPEKVGGDVTVSSFNVLNYFTDLGESEAGCKSYDDREGNPVTANRCDVRGAYSKAAFERQQQKIVSAIAGLDASVVSLEEIETSSKFGHDRDASLAALVKALNERAGREQWAYVPSPSRVPASEDVIRLAFVYQKGKVEPVGESRILTGNKEFAGYAREPLGQEWRALDAAGAPRGEAFAVVANHFKSKGSLASAYPNDSDPYQGNNNRLRTAQAKALAQWAKEQYGNRPTFLVGDFNSYSAEDPILALRDAGYSKVRDSIGRADHSYQFGGAVGSLDHVLANDAARRMVAGADVWSVNAMESPAFEYSRNNYNVKQLWDGGPFRSSDHDPVKVGVNVGKAPQPPGPRPSDPDAAKPIADPCIESRTCTAYFVDDLATHRAKLGMVLAQPGEAIAGDWDGDGIATLGVRNGAAFTLYGVNRSGGATSTVAFEGADSGEILVGDVDGDGKDDLVLHKGRLFAAKTDLTRSGPASVSFSYGREGDAGLVGDWDGDGKATPGVRRGNGVYLRNALGGGEADVAYRYGRAGDVPLVGDWDGDGRDTVSVRRGHILFATNATKGGPAETAFSFGRASDSIVAGDWNGDRRDAVAAIRR